MSEMAPVGTLRPIYIVVVFWGDANRDHFATMLLPSLLAPSNLAAIKDVVGSKLVICTTRHDWSLSQNLPLFKEASSLIEVQHIEIGFPAPGADKYRHVSLAFKQVIDLCWRDRAYASLLSPDIILSDGTFAYLRGQAERGIEAVLVPALRFETEKCVAALKASSLMEPDRPVVASARQLAAIAEQGLHFEMRRFEWDAAHFGQQPISVWWRLQEGGGILLHTTSWAMALVNFGALSELQQGSLDRTTLDDIFILENFFKFRENGKLHLVTDSDDMLMLPLTGGSELVFVPAQPSPLNRIPFLRNRAKLWSLQLYLTSPLFDSFRRWAVALPTFIHSRSLNDSDRKKAMNTAGLLQRAILAPSLLPRIYGRCPRWPVLRTAIALLLRGYHRTRGKPSSQASSQEAVQ
jgi:hypothetical protein